MTNVSISEFLASIQDIDDEMTIKRMELMWESSDLLSSLRLQPSTDGMLEETEHELSDEELKRLTKFLRILKSSIVSGETTKRRVAIAAIRPFALQAKPQCLSGMMDDILPLATLLLKGSSSTEGELPSEFDIVAASRIILSLGDVARQSSEHWRKFLLFLPKIMGHILTLITAKQHLTPLLQLTGTLFAIAPSSCAPWQVRLRDAVWSLIPTIPLLRCLPAHDVVHPMWDAALSLLALTEDRSTMWSDCTVQLIGRIWHCPTEWIQHATSSSTSTSGATPNEQSSSSTTAAVAAAIFPWPMELMQALPVNFLPALLVCCLHGWSYHLHGKSVSTCSLPALRLACLACGGEGAGQLPLSPTLPLRGESLQLLQASLQQATASLLHVALLSTSSTLWWYGNASGGEKPSLLSWCLEEVASPRESSILLAVTAALSATHSWSSTPASLITAILTATSSRQSQHASAAAYTTPASLYVCATRQCYTVPDVLFTALSMLVTMQHAAALSLATTLLLDRQSTLRVPSPTMQAHYAVGAALLAACSPHIPSLRQLPVQWRQQTGLLSIPPLAHSLYASALQLTEQSQRPVVWEAKLYWKEAIEQEEQERLRAEQQARDHPSRAIPPIFFAEQEKGRHDNGMVNASASAWEEQQVVETRKKRSLPVVEDSGKKVKHGVQDREEPRQIYTAAEIVSSAEVPLVKETSLTNENGNESEGSLELGFVDAPASSDED